MGNDVAKASPFGGKVTTVNTADLAKKAAEAAANNPRGGAAPDGSTYANFSGKRGRFEVGTGESKRTIEGDEWWLLNVASFQEGWVCWQGGRPTAKRMANIYNEPPVPQPTVDEQNEVRQSGKDGDGWFAAKAWVMKSLDDGTQAYFLNNSVSGVSEMADMMKAFSERAQGGMPAWPIFQCQMEEFSAQGYKNFKPKFVIVGWLGDEQVAKLAQDEKGDLDIEDLIAEAAAGQAPKVEKTKDSPPEGDKETGGSAAAVGSRRRRRSG